MKDEINGGIGGAIIVPTQVTQTPLLIHLEEEPSILAEGSLKDEGGIKDAVMVPNEEGFTLDLLHVMRPLDTHMEKSSRQQETHGWMQGKGPDCTCKSGNPLCPGSLRIMGAGETGSLV